MPIYDRMCSACGWVKADNFEPVTFTLACPSCGAETSRVWVARQSTSIVGDEWPGGKTFENIDDKPITVFSRSELRRELAARGLQEFVRHMPTPGSDKSPHTSRMDAPSPYTLEQAAKILERVCPS